MTEVFLFPSLFYLPSLTRKNKEKKGEKKKRQFVVFVCKCKDAMNNFTTVIHHFKDNG